MPTWIRINARLLRLTVAAELRNPGLRLLWALGLIGGGVFGWTKASVVGSSAVAMTLWLSRAYGIAAALWFAYAAIRDQVNRGGALVRCKPVDGAHWVALTWASGVLVWLILLGSAFFGAAVAQFPKAGMVALASQGLGFARAGVVVVLVSTLSYGLSRLVRSPLGGIITMFAWFCAMAGLRYIPSYLQLDYSQNQGAFLTIAVWLLALVGLIVERARRGELRRPLGPAIVVLLLFGLAAGAAAQIIRRPPAMYGKAPTLWDAIRMQHLQATERAPGFWLPDGRGGTVRTADYRGKILLIYLFGATDLDAARVLPDLASLQQEYGERGVQALGVCFSADHGAGRALAKAGGYNFPIGSDLSTLKVGDSPEAAVADAYQVQTMPVLIITNRRRHIKFRSDDLSYSLDDLRRLVEERLGEEPE